MLYQKVKIVLHKREQQLSIITLLFWMKYNAVCIAAGHKHHLSKHKHVFNLCCQHVGGTTVWVLAQNTKNIITTQTEIHYNLPI